jgi:hypothetical protein
MFKVILDHYLQVDTQSREDRLSSTSRLFATYYKPGYYRRACLALPLSPQGLHPGFTRESPRIEVGANWVRLDYPLCGS